MKRAVIKSKRHKSTEIYKKNLFCNKVKICHEYTTRHGLTN